MTNDTYHSDNYAGIAIWPCTGVYLALLALTCITWIMGQSNIQDLSLSLMVLGFALFKGWLIGDYFMGLRFVSSIWRWVIIFWLMLTGSLIAWAFILAR